MKTPESHKPVPLQTMVKEFLDRKIPLAEPALDASGDAIAPGETYREFMQKHLPAIELYEMAKEVFLSESLNSTPSVIVTDDGMQPLIEHAYKGMLAVAMPKDHSLHQEEMKLGKKILNLYHMLGVLEAFESGKRTETGCLGLFSQEKKKLAKAMECLQNIREGFLEYADDPLELRNDLLINKLRKEAQPEDTLDILHERAGDFADRNRPSDPDVSFDLDMHQETYRKNNEAIAVILRDMEEQLKPIMKKLGVGVGVQRA